MRTRTPPWRTAASTGITSSWPVVPSTMTMRSYFPPAADGSSATSGTSAGGTLSILYQPRSSRLFATVLRPAPDSPAMTTISLTVLEATGPRGPAEPLCLSARCVGSA